MKMPLRLIVVLCFLFAAVAVMGFLLGPYVLDSYVLPQLLKKIALRDTIASISHLTPYSIRGRLELGDGDIPALSIPHFELTYTPASLLNKRAATLELDHATIHLRKQGKTIILNGFTPTVLKGAEPGNSELLFLLPFTIDTVILKQCSVILHRQGRPDLRLTASAETSLRFDKGNAKGYPLRSLEGSFILYDAISGTGSFSLTPGSLEHKVLVELQTGMLQGLDLFTPAPLRSSMLGPLSAEASLTLDSETMALSRINVTGGIKHFQPAFGPLSLSGTATDGALDFSFSGTPAAMNYTVQSFAVSEPLPLKASITGIASFISGDITTEGSIDAVIEADTVAGETTLPLSLKYTGRFSPDSDWHLGLSASYKASQPHTLSHEGVSVVIPYLDIAGVLNGSAEYQNAAFTLTSKPFTLISNETEITVADLALKTVLKREKGNISTRISGSIPKVFLPATKLQAEDIHLDLPIEFPLSAQRESPSGKFSIGSMSLEKTPLLSASTTISQQGETFHLAGSIKALFSPILNLSFKGSVEPPTKSANLAWNLTETPINSFSLPPVFKIPDTITFDAPLAAEGKIRYQNNRISGTVQTTVNLATLAIPEKNISLQGITCALELPRLPELASTPSQLCSIETIDAGNMHFSEAKITFRVEDPETIFIEKSRVTWCRGTLDSGSLRLSTIDRKIDTTLYCSRINFAELLNQFGLDQTEGQGTLNGKLPIELSQEGLHFDDGFLFSTPGTGGIIRFTNTDILRQGMGAVTETGSLNYSMKALEDFAYSWTKLSFNSSGEELLLAMELDGKPRTPLPFGFKNGMIIETNQGDGLQYPIRLDVNFRLPLARLFQVGQNIQSFMENM